MRQSPRNRLADVAAGYRDWHPRILAHPSISSTICATKRLLVSIAADAWRRPPSASAVFRPFGGMTWVALFSKGIFTNQQGVCKRPFAEVAECSAGGGTGSQAAGRGREGG